MNFKTTLFLIILAFLSLSYLVPKALAGDIIIDGARISNSAIISGSNSRVTIKGSDAGSSINVSNSRVQIAGSGEARSTVYVDGVRIENVNGVLTIKFDSGRKCTVSSTGPFVCKN